MRDVSEGEAIALLFAAVRQQAEHDVTVRYEGKPRRRKRIECLAGAEEAHDACRCALEHLKRTEAVRLVVAAGLMDAEEALAQLFAA